MARNSPNSFRPTSVAPRDTTNSCLSSKPFMLHKEASELGIGCALFQFQDEKYKVIGYRSCTLVGAGLKYHSSKLEFLALKWAVCEHFRDYLFYVSHFDVYTDCNPLMYIKSTCKVNAIGQWWINELADYIFLIHYKPRVENAVPDTFNSLPILDAKDLKAYSQLCCVDEVKAVFDGVVSQSCNGETCLPKVNVVHAKMKNQKE